MKICSYCFFFTRRRRHTRCGREWSSDVCSPDLFGAPAGRVLIGKESRRAAEHRLQRLPQATRAIEMKDVRQLVYDHEPLPAVVGLQCGIRDRWNEQNREAVGGKDARESVRRVDGVRQREVDDAARGMQLSREQRIRSLRLRRRDDGARAQCRTKMDTKTRCMERPPGS